MSTPTLATRRHVLVTPLDARRTALRSDDTLVIAPSLAQSVNLAHQEYQGVSRGDLADVTQWMRDWAFSPAQAWDPIRLADELLGYGHYLGETWRVYAVITRTAPVVRYIARPRLILAVAR